MAANKDVIIVGAGHNGLVAAGYLARAGINVQVLERRDVVGGAAITEEWFPGYQISTCSYICHMLQKKVIDELELRKYGFHVYTIDPSRVHPFPNGKVVRMWHDDKRTAEEIRQISPHDAEAWMEWAEFWERANGILSEYYLAPPPTLSQVMARFREAGEEDLLDTLLTVPLKDLVDRHFESDEIRSMLSTGAVDQGDITAPGSAYMHAIYRFAAYRPDRENVGVVRGGMGGITQSMARSAEAHGAAIRTGAEVKRILTDNGRATGVELVSGEVLQSDIVVSNADPKRTFLTLIDPEALDADFVQDVRALKTDSASVKFLCSMKELPDYSAYLGAEFDPKEVAMVTICPTPDYSQASWADARNGRVSSAPIIQVQIPTVYDPTVSPQGHHVMSMWVTYEPPHLKDGSWEDARQEAGEQLIDVLSGYAPNIRDAIIDWTLLTPEDIEARVGLTDGNIRHIDIIPQQMMGRRPLPGWSDYRTPIQGLYLCGAGTHPGGEVTGAPGHNAAHVILQELGAQVAVRSA